MVSLASRSGRGSVDRVEAGMSLAQAILMKLLEHHLSQSIRVHSK